MKPSELAGKVHDLLSTEGWKGHQAPSESEGICFCTAMDRLDPPSEIREVLEDELFAGDDPPLILWWKPEAPKGTQEGTLAAIKQAEKSLKERGQ